MTPSESDSKRMLHKQFKIISWKAYPTGCNIQSVVQKGEIIEEITPSQEKKRRKRRNRLKTNTNEKRIEETVLFEQNYIDRNSISMDNKVNNHKPFKGMDTDTVMVEPKSAVVKNSTSSVEDVQDGSSVEISAGNLVEKPVLNTARRCGRRKAGKQIDQVLEDNVEDRDDNNLVTGSAMVELKSAVVGNSTTLGDVQNGSMVEISAGNSVDKPVLDTAKRCRRRKKAGKQIGQVLTDNVEARDDANSVQSSDEEVEGQRGEKKKKKGLKEILKEKISAEDEDNSITIEKVEVTVEDAAGDHEEKKGFLEKIKSKLPGSHSKKAEDGSTAAADHSGEAEGEKKGLFEKIKEKLPGYHKNGGEEKDKEKGMEISANH